MKKIFACSFLLISVTQFASAPIPFAITERNSDHITWEGSYEISSYETGKWGYDLVCKIVHATIIKSRNDEKIEIAVDGFQTHTADLSTLVRPLGRLISLKVKGSAGSEISSTRLNVALENSEVDFTIPFRSN